jgi:endonuclease/exonuclease/phosphatase family metal-dependent hydrolase
MMPTTTLVLPRPVFVPDAGPVAAAPLPSWNRPARPRLRRGLAIVPLLLVLAAGVVTGRGSIAVTVAENRSPRALSPAPRPAGWLRLLTYNIAGLPGWMVGASERRFGRMSREIDRLDADVVLLQEAWTAAAHRAMPSAGTWWVARADDGSFLFDSSNGLLTVSRFPVVHTQFHPFSRAGFPDSLVGKGALETTLDLPGGRRLNVWNVHLQSRDNEGEIRASQIAELTRWVRDASVGQQADVIAGDFNSEPGSDAYRQLARLGRDVQGVGTGAHFTTFDGWSSDPQLQSTLDYVFVRPGPGIDVAGLSNRPALTAPSASDQLSDHVGLLVVLRLGGS